MGLMYRHTVSPAPPAEFMTKLRRLYGAAGNPDHDDFNQRLTAAGDRDFTQQSGAMAPPLYLSRRGPRRPHCDINLVMRHYDLFGQTVRARVRAHPKTGIVPTAMPPTPASAISLSTTAR